MLNYQRLWQFWGFFIFEMEWSPLGTLRCYHCDGGPCHVWLPRVPYSFYVYILSNVSHHPQNENKRYCGTPTTEFRSLRIGLWWFGAPENRVFTIWVWGGTDFLGNGHSSEIYIYIYYIIFFCYHARRQKSHIPGTMYRSKPWQFYWSFDLCQKFPYWISCFSQKSTESSVGNPPGTSYAVLCFPGKSDRSRDYLIGQQVTIYYPQWISMGNIYLWNMGNISVISMKVFINRTLFFPNRLIFVDSHYSQSYHVWMLIFLQNPPIMPISL